MKISKNKKMRFFLMSQGSLNPKIKLLVQNVCPVARSHTDTQTDRHTDRVTTEGTLSQGFMIIKAQQMFTINACSTSLSTKRVLDSLVTLTLPLTFPRLARSSGRFVFALV